MELWSYATTSAAASGGVSRSFLPGQARIGCLKIMFINIPTWKERLKKCKKDFYKELNTKASMDVI